MRNKQDLEATEHIESCDLTAITEAWWDQSHNGALQSMLINHSGRTDKEERESVCSLCEKKV